MEDWYRHRLLHIPRAKYDVIAQMDQAWDEAVADEGIQFKDVAEACRLKQQTADLVTTYLGSIPEDEPLPLAVEGRWEMPLVDPDHG